MDASGSKGIKSKERSKKRIVRSRIAADDNGEKPPLYVISSPAEI